MHEFGLERSTPAIGYCYKMILGLLSCGYSGMMFVYGLEIFG